MHWIGWELKLNSWSMDEVVYLGSPLGSIEVSGSDLGITTVRFSDKDEEETSEIKSSEVLECKKQLLEYFDNKRNWFSVKLNPIGTDFQKSVWDCLIQIPFGKTSTYSEIAETLGDIKSVRAVGNSNAKNPIAIIIPCHRVIGKSGDLVGYAGGLHRKEWLLKHEGVIDQSQLNLF